MQIYVAGPMRGIKDCNFPTFKEARERIRKLGHIVYCPAALAQAVELSPEDDIQQKKLTYAALQDITCLLHAEAIALLPGWEKSVGVSMELALAQFLRLKVLDATTLEEVHPVVKPWIEIQSLKQQIEELNWQLSKLRKGDKDDSE